MIRPRIACAQRVGRKDSKSFEDRCVIKVSADIIAMGSQEKRLEGHAHRTNKPW